jgi:hypothetical protein
MRTGSLSHGWLHILWDPVNLIEHQKLQILCLHPVRVSYHSRGGEE